MNFWAVCMVKDELDVLPYTLAHLESEGIDGIIVADNLSTDGTWEWLNDTTFATDVRLERDTQVGYYQSAKMTALVQQAAGYAADWVLPFDADELWHNARAPLTLKETLLDGQMGADCYQAALYNYFPMVDDPEEPNPFLRITHRDPEPGQLRKVIVRARPDVVVMQGNHAAQGNSAFAEYPTPIEVAHFPWRSPQQFERKVRNGSSAYLATDLPAEMGAHWRSYGTILRTGGSEALRDVFDTWFCSPELKTIHTPAPWCRFAESGAGPRV